VKITPADERFDEPREWQDPDQYIVGIQPTDEGSWTPIWCNGEFRWVTGDHIQPEEWFEYERRREVLP
jgi:hypothetical protein